MQQNLILEVNLDKLGVGLFHRTYLRMPKKIHLEKPTLKERITLRTLILQCLISEYACSFTILTSIEITIVNGTLTGNDDQASGFHVARIGVAKDDEVGMGIAPREGLRVIRVCDGL